jgi:hypothetical protein
MNWKPIPGTHYSANDEGHILNTSTGKILKQVRRKNGYGVVIIGGVQCYAHRLILWAFTGYQGEEANHINRNKLDNRLINLEWTDRKGNLSHFRRSLIEVMEAKGQLRMCFSIVSGKGNTF